MLNQGLRKNIGHNMALQKKLFFISRTEKMNSFDFSALKINNGHIPE